MTPDGKSAIVVLGGFLSQASVYSGFSSALKSFSGKEVCGIQRGGHMSRWVQQYVPDAAFAPEVRYTSVAGKYTRGDLTGSLLERFAFRAYKEICTDGAVWGDGIVPVDSALLPNSEQIVLEGVSHHSVIGKPWYGNASVLPLWWRP
ncbi:MAG: hypothetical protein P8169_02525 [Chloroflexota bacterium]